MDFETFHAEQERIRKEKQAADKGAASSSFQEYLDAVEEKRRRSDDYIAYLLAIRETASRNGQDPDHEAEEAMKVADALRAQIADLRKEADKGAESAAEAKKYRDTLEKTRIVMNAGLDPKFADRLKGETPAEWKADAAMLAKDFARPQRVAPIGSAEPTSYGKPDTRALFAQWAMESMFPEG